jgi:hypothetical protein
LERQLVRAGRAEPVLLVVFQTLASGGFIGMIVCASVAATTGGVLVGLLVGPEPVLLVVAQTLATARDHAPTTRSPNLPTRQWSDNLVGLSLRRWQHAQLALPLPFRCR